MSFFTTSGPDYYTAGPAQQEQASAPATVAVFAAAIVQLGSLGAVQTFGSHATALYNAEAEKSTVWKSQPGGTGLVSVTPATAFVNTAYGPQIDGNAVRGAYYTFQAAPASGGGLPSSWTFGVHATAIYNAEALKTQVWRASLTGGVVSTDVLGSEYLFGTHAAALYNAEAVKGYVQKSLVGTFIAPAVVGSFVSVPPQQFDPTPGLQPFIDEPTFNPQGFIVPFQEAEPVSGAEFQPSPVLTPRSTAPLAQPLVPYFAAPQLLDLTIPAVVQKSLPAAQGTAAVPTFAATLPQTDTVASWPPRYFASQANPQGPTLKQYVVPPQVFDFTLPPVYQRALFTALPRSTFFVAAPQAFDFTLPPVIRTTVESSQGPTVRQFFTPPQAFDFTLPAQVHQTFAPAALLTNALGSWVAGPAQRPDQAAGAAYYFHAAKYISTALGTFLYVPPWLAPSQPAPWLTAPMVGYVPHIVNPFVFARNEDLRYRPTAAPWFSAPVVGTPPNTGRLGLFVNARNSDLIYVPTAAPLFVPSSVTGLHQFGWAEIIALKQVGVAGLNVIIATLSQSGIQGAKSRFINGSACYVVATYYDVNNINFVPSAVQYRVDDLVSMTNIVPWTAITPALMNTIAVSSAQNQMISLSRNCEEHQMLFQITDGFGEQFLARVEWDLIRVAGDPEDGNE